MISRTPQDLELLELLVTTPSPPGQEGRLQSRLAEWARPFCDDLRQDSHGNLIAIRYADKNRAPKGASENQKVLLAGHCDQLSLMVIHIDESGFLLVPYQAPPLA